MVHQLTTRAEGPDHAPVDGADAASDATPTGSDTSLDPRTGEALGEVPCTSSAEVETVLARAADAAPTLAVTSPAERAGWLRALADALEAPDTAHRLVALADRETALGEVRLTGELARVAAQLRFYADVAQEGSWLRAAVDHATATTPCLGRVQQPLGPVAVFGASNFPFAFGVLGNDTASALAAGCPVVAKAHPAHPLLSAELGRLATGALGEAGAPAGAFGPSPAQTEAPAAPRCPAPRPTAAAPLVPLDTPGSRDRCPPPSAPRTPPPPAPPPPARAETPPPAAAASARNPPARPKTAAGSPGPAPASIDA
jgi:NADP-dependent aldehyde dehydrogenase